jgi:4-diphosphocytidyl-2-C-methyl-D-erythritol kinase
MSGMGEKLETIKNFPKLTVLIVNPKGEISTLLAYGELDKKLWFMADKRRRNISGEMAMNAKNYEAVSRFLYNDFEIVAKEKFPEIEVLEKAMISLGAAGASISGKGPTVFGIFKDKKTAEKTKNILRHKYPNFFVEIG